VKEKGKEEAHSERIRSLNNTQQVILQSISYEGCNCILPFQKSPEAEKTQKALRVQSIATKEVREAAIQCCCHP